MTGKILDFWESFFLVSFLPIPVMLIFAWFAAEYYKERICLYMILGLSLAIGAARFALFVFGNGGSRRYLAVVIWLLALIAVPGVFGLVKLLTGSIPAWRKIFRWLPVVLFAAIFIGSAWKGLNPPRVIRRAYWSELRNLIESETKSQDGKIPAVVMISNDGKRFGSASGIGTVQMSPMNAGRLLPLLLHELRLLTMDQSKAVFLIDSERCMETVRNELEKCFLVNNAGGVERFRVYRIRNRNPIKGAAFLALPEVLVFPANTGLNIYAPAIMVAGSGPPSWSSNLTIVDDRIKIDPAKSDHYRRIKPLFMVDELGNYIAGHPVLQIYVPNNETLRMALASELERANWRSNDFELSCHGKKVRVILQTPPAGYLRQTEEERLKQLKEWDSMFRNYPLSVRKDVLALPVYAFLAPEDYDADGAPIPDRVRDKAIELLTGYYEFISE